MSASHCLPQGLSYFSYGQPTASHVQASTPSYVYSPTGAQYDSGDVTLQRIYEVANVDVEMKDVFNDKTYYLVLDTNVLINHLDVIRRFEEDVAGHGVPVVVVIPNVLLSELDGLKKRKNDVGWFARMASSWILDRVTNPSLVKTVKVQSRREALPDNYTDPSRIADQKIENCARYFAQKGQVVLLTGDVIMQIEADADGTPSMLDFDWSSRGIVQALRKYGLHADIHQFRENENLPSYGPAREGRGGKGRALTVPTGGSPPPEPDEDGMDVDEELRGPAKHVTYFENYVPSHALDSLHLQVIDHFALVLKDLASRVRAGAGDGGPIVQSSHAPWYRRKEFVHWTVGDCLDYLNSKKQLRVSNPSPRVFLLRRNEDRGWRRGQDWSRQDWENVMAALHDIGVKFEDASVLESLVMLREETDRVFKSPLRPTGI